MLQDYVINLGITSFAFGRVLWTLSVEWWLYMLSGLFVISLMSGKKLTFFSVFLFILFLVSTVEHIYGGRGNGLGLLWLCAFASVYFFHENEFEFNKCLVVLLGLLLLFLVYQRFYIAKTFYDFQGMFLLMCLFLLCLKLIGGISVSFSKNKLVTVLAGSSYALYLVHYSIIDFYMAFFKVDIFYIDFFVPYALSMIVSVVLWFFFDRHYRAVANKVKVVLKRNSPEKS